MKQKEKILLRYLIERKDEYVTSRYLASELLLSDRTVRNYLHHLKEAVEKNGGRIIAKQGQGYQLQIVHKLTFDLFLSQQEILPGRREDAREVFLESEDRQKYLLNKLLLEEEVLFMDDLAEELYLSRSSLAKDIKKIKAKLAPYSLKILSKYGKGMWIEGKERDKRHFIMNTFFGSSYANSLKEYLGNSHFFSEISFEELAMIILDEAREAKLKISDFIIQNLALHLALGIKRMRAGFEIQDLGIENELSDRMEYQVAEKIVERIKVVANVSFPPEEISYLTLHLMAKSNRNETKSNHTLKKEITKAISHLSQYFNEPLTEDQQLQNGLLDHLAPMLVRLERGITLENPLTEEIKKANQLAFEATKSCFGELPVLSRFSVNDDEWAYLALHLMAALEKAKAAQKIRVLIICATGYGSAQLLRNRVVNEFGKTVIVTDVKGYYEIDEASLEGADLILSSIDLSSMVFKLPVLHVSVFLNEEDVHRIRKSITQLTSQQQTVTDTCTFSVTQKQKIYAQQLSERFFKVYENSPEKETVIHDLLELLSSNEEGDYPIKMKKQIKRRQEMGQIIFSDTVAVPHPAIPIGVETKIAVALIPDGMQWDDYGRIRFVFLVSPSYIENEGITVVTKAIVKLVDRLEIQQAILAEPTFENFNTSFIKLI
ncbi:MULTISPECIES: PRD domain-containing protein [unclassified Enterococcus]|uniref:BglG family transcription antiterminator n=1 Tax=unclassified Enterococcus TaxID=2608891 RepID=UPI0013EAA4D5|nr:MULTISPECIES: PRD domain-containing protein [unclassified Enterococcus]